MATQAQIEANRRNAMKSTGPRSAEGKAASRFNALKHGIDARSLVIPGEDPDDLETLMRNYREQFHPVGPVEDFLVDTLIQSDWDKRRWTRLRAELLQTPGAHESKRFDRLARQLAAAQRDWVRAFRELNRVQKQRAAHEEIEEAEVKEAAPANENRLRSEQPRAKDRDPGLRPVTPLQEVS